MSCPQSWLDLTLLMRCKRYDLSQRSSPASVAKEVGITEGDYCRSIVPGVTRNRAALSQI